MDFERLHPDTPEWARYFAGHQARYRFSVAHLPQGTGRELLDVACGVGYGARLLAEATGARVIAVDRDAGALAMAAARYAHPLVDFRQEDAVALRSVAGQSCAGVVCLETVEHLPDPGSFLDRLCQVMVPGAPLIISTPNVLVTGRVAGGWAYHEREYTPHEFASLLRSHGFADVAIYGQTWSAIGRLRDAMRAEVHRLRFNPVTRIGFAVQRLLGREALPVALPEQLEDFEFVRYETVDACERLGAAGPFVLVAVAHRS